MISIYQNGEVKKTNEGELLYVELRGLSTDTKPTKVGNKGIVNGSLFVEIDTQKIFFFDEDSQTWKGE